MRKLLVVDDEGELCDFLRDIFARRGYQVSVATSGEAALAKIEEEKPEVVLLDLKLPDISGVEILRRVKEMGKDTTVIAMTGYPDTSLAREVKSLGVYDYIYKPFNIEEIEKVADRLTKI